MNESNQVIITGISSDLGSILAKELAVDQDVVILGTMRRKLTKNDVFTENIHILDNCDLTNPQSCLNLAEKANQLFDGPIGLIHCVGDFWDHIPFLDFSSENAQRLFESHVVTFYNVLQTIIPIMQVNGGGSTIAFSCQSVKYNYPWMAAFTASKSAVDALIRSMSNEFSGNHIRFNSLVLASLQTDKVRDSKPHGDFMNFIPPKDITPIVKFLLSQESYLVNGNDISLFKHSDKFYRTGYFDRVSK